jgi:hypothetical protein
MQLLKKGVLIWIIGLMAFLPTAAMALKTSVAGHVETKGILRWVDYNAGRKGHSDMGGLKNGIDSYSELVSLRTELKIDVLLRPEYTNIPDFRFEKVNMIYKGAYDAIFDLTDRYDNLPVNVDTHEYEVGRDQLRFENDLKEIYADFVYQTSATSTTMRLGRQMVLWGEDTGHFISNVLVPMDLRFATLGANPEEFSQALWMARFDHNIAGFGPLDELSFQLILIPEIRPFQFPIGFDANGPSEWWLAPYAGAFGAFAMFGEIQPVVPSSGMDNMQVATKVSFTVGEFHMETSYFDGYHYMPAFRFAGGKMLAEHPTSENLAISGNYYSEMLRGVVAFEAGCNFNQPFAHFGDSASAGFLNKMFDYSFYDSYQFHMSFGDTITKLAKYIGTATPVSATYSVYHRYIAGYDEATAAPAPMATKQDNTALGLTLTCDWDAGRLAPMVSLEYDTEGLLYTFITLTFTRGSWYFKIGQTSSWYKSGADTTMAQKHRNRGSDEFTFMAGYNF